MSGRGAARELLREVDREIEETRCVELAVIARYYHVTTESVRRWIKAGRIPAHRTPSGRFKVSAATFEEIKTNDRNASHERQRFT